VLLYSLRLLWLRLTFRRRPGLGFNDLGVLPMRVRLGDLDQLGHVNNGVYLSMLDIGRFDLLFRSGAWKRLMDAAYYPVVASQTITYRKSLRWRQRFHIETRMLGYADKALYMDQRFVVDGEIWARAIIKARFLKRSGGTVSIEELSALAGDDLSATPVEEWIRRWADDAALPSTRAEAPSLWD
jgi:YbgC/YbaW family acyl-CoA thioester hydrolase